MREREGLFNEFIVDVRRREKDEKQQRKEQVCAIAPSDVLMLSMQFVYSCLHSYYVCYATNRQRKNYVYRFVCPCVCFNYIYYE